MKNIELSVIICGLRASSKNDTFIEICKLYIQNWLLGFDTDITEKSKPALMVCAQSNSVFNDLTSSI